jgi:hypothetical protein
VRAGLALLALRSRTQSLLFLAAKLAHLEALLVYLEFQNKKKERMTSRLLNNVSRFYFWNLILEKERDMRAILEIGRSKKCQPVRRINIMLSLSNFNHYLTILTFYIKELFLLLKLPFSNIPNPRVLNSREMTRRHLV